MPKIPELPELPPEIIDFIFARVRDPKSVITISQVNKKMHSWLANAVYKIHPESADGNQLHKKLPEISKTIQERFFYVKQKKHITQIERIRTFTALEYNSSGFITLNLLSICLFFKSVHVSYNIFLSLDANIITSMYAGTLLSLGCVGLSMLFYWTVQKCLEPWDIKLKRELDLCRGQLRSVPEIQAIERIESTNP
ncbi:MAG TPA: F-box protein [Legionella sp.]|nr:F-box protein [Legionella sp.]